MPKLGDIATKVRSKNAGPFWITIDIFCNAQTYPQIKHALKTETLAKCLATPINQCKRFEIDSLNVIKFSIPRSLPQGDCRDRDMHGAGLACLCAEIPLNLKS